MPGRSVSSACLLRQVSSGLSRNCRNERRHDVDGNRHSDRNLAPQRLCDRSYDKVDQMLRAAVGSWIAVGAADEVVAT